MVPLAQPTPYNPNGILIGSAVFAWITIVTDRPTDRPRYSVCSNRTHLRSTGTAMRPDKARDFHIEIHMYIYTTINFTDEFGNVSVTVTLMCR